ncbi:MAG: hypothetical protein MN733_06580 [Nitrososphaera sp.]|nr:hypothetical protein [Nitrososphaera sp.]
MAKRSRRKSLSGFTKQRVTVQAKPFIEYERVEKADGTTHTRFAINMTKPTERAIAYTIAVVFMVFMLSIAISVPNPTSFQYTVFRTVLALAGGGFASMIPGFISVQVRRAVRAGGALAVFVVLYFFSPAALVLNPSDISTVVPRPQTQIPGR